MTSLELPSIKIDTSAFDNLSAGLNAYFAPGGEGYENAVNFYVNQVLQQKDNQLFNKLPLLPAPLHIQNDQRVLNAVSLYNGHEVGKTYEEAMKPATASPLEVPKAEPPNINVVPAPLAM